MLGGHISEILLVELLGVYFCIKNVLVALQQLFDGDKVGHCVGSLSKLGSWASNV